jgi:hypothetical protein
VRSFAAVILVLAVACGGEQPPPAETERVVAEQEKCGNTTCPEGCECQITKCDKIIQPGCEDLGLCFNCPIPHVEPTRRN